MAVDFQTVELGTSPHTREEAGGVRAIMLNVVYALIPISLFAVYRFGVSAMALLFVCVVSCLLTEYAVCKLSGKESTLGDFSAVITGILLALTLPPGFPLWMGVVAGVVSIGLGKALFGGMGYNVFNPALVGRAFAQAAFPVAITTWTPGRAADRFIEFIPSSLAMPFMTPADVSEWSGMDGFSGATPLSLQKFDQVVTALGPLFTGTTAGSLGETSAVLIALCGIYLIARKMMDWRIPVMVLASAFVTGAVFYLLNKETNPNPFFILCSGGLMLGAFFMASDMVGSPVTPVGVCIYGALIGFITVIIRLFGGLPEGIMYAILLGNALTPIIDDLTQPRIFGAVKKRKAES